MNNSNTQSARLQYQDITFLKGLVAEVVVGSLLQGIFFLLAYMAVYTLARQGLRDFIARRFLLAAVVMVLISSTLTFASILTVNVQVLDTFGPNPVAAAFMMSKSFDIAIIGSRINYLLSEVIVVWRAWILSDSLCLRMILVVGLLGTLGGLTTEMVINWGQFFSTSISTNTRLDLIVYMPLLTTNILSTVTIAYKMWIYRRLIKITFNQRSRGQRVERVLMLFVESGAIYASFWILSLIVEYRAGAPSGRFRLSSEFGATLSYLAPQVAALYPVVVILLVERSKRSDLLSEGSSTTQPIQFVAPCSPISQSFHSRSIIQSIADHMRSHQSDEEFATGGIEEIQVIVGRGQKRTELASMNEIGIMAPPILDSV